MVKKWKKILYRPGMLKTLINKKIQVKGTKKVRYSDRILSDQQKYENYHKSKIYQKFIISIYHNILN